MTGGADDNSQHYPPAEQPTDPPPASAAPGDLLPRFGARCIDTLLAGILGGLLWAVIDAKGGGLLGSSLGVSAFYLVVLGYFLLCEKTMSSTPGKKLLGLRIEGPGPQGQLTPEESVKRNFYLLVGIIPWLGPVLSIALKLYIAVTIEYDPNKQGWHDKYAGGTRVVKVSTGSS